MNLIGNLIVNLFVNRFYLVSIKDKATNEKFFQKDCDTIISVFIERVAKINTFKFKHFSKIH